LIKVIACSGLSEPPKKEHQRMVKVFIFAALCIAIVIGVGAFLWQRRALPPATVPSSTTTPTEAATTGAGNYYVDIDSIREILPTGVMMPAKLERFLQWAATQPNGSIGAMEFAGSRFDDYWIENGSVLAPKFVLFAHLGDGTDIGYWLYDGRTIENSPIVLIGSEGDLDILANGLEEFLAGLINDNYSRHSELSAEKDEDDSDWVDRRPALAVLLKDTFGFTRDSAVDYQQTAQATHPDFKEWMLGWGKAQEKNSLADPSRQAIANATKARWSKLKDSWNSINIDLFVADGKVSQQIFRNTTKPLAELERVTPHVLALREVELKAAPERGAFHFISLRIDQRGHVGLMRQDHFKELGTSDVNIPEGGTAAILADLKKYPRSAYWTPRWLARLQRAR
jgi:hypothetical protein